MSLNKNNLTLYFLIFFNGLAFGQVQQERKNDSIVVEQLEPVLITATRTLRQLSSVPLPAQVISKKDIDRINAVRLSEVLNEQTGLVTVPDFGGGEGIQMQGLDSQYTLILIDGVPLVGRSAGTLDLSRISVGNIKQIEIVKGASSSLFGNEALGGVVNIITEDPKPGFKGNIRYRGGSLNAHDIATNINVKNEKVGYTLFVNRNSSEGYDLLEGDGFNTVEPFENYTINAKVSYQVSNDTKLTGSGRFYHQNQDNVASQDLAGKSEINEWNALIKADHEFNDRWNSYLELYGTQFKAEEFLNDPLGDTFSQNNFDQLFLRPEVRTTFKPNSEHNLIAGFGLTHETLRRTDFFETPIFNAPYIYVQYDGNFFEHLNIILGARYDSHNEYESQFSPKLALRYALTETLAVKGSVGYGFKAPDFRQLYFDFSNATIGYTVLGYNAVPDQLQELDNQGRLTENSSNNLDQIISQFNGELRPERSVALNLGFDFKPSSSIQLSINVFRNTISNLIDTRVIANQISGQNVFSYFNIDEAYTQGLEFNSSFNISDNLNISGGYQLLFARDKTAEDDFNNGEVTRQITNNGTVVGFTTLDLDDYFGLFNRSRHMANLKVFYNIPQWNLNTNIRGVYRSKFGLFDTNGNAYLDTFDEFVEANVIWDFAINKTLFKDYELGFGIDNVFNFRDVPSGPDDGIFISNIPGRIFYGTLNINI
ncbi:TonB-dependent receptor plug domain-containing protein [uncultured Winogradskyella sp.]|uniref:TonB-dependent receptor plug domain-containing protein n=1 Tax=uncultured Winogradskyella sp. TaxID=395353 RepID=UPI003512653C